MSPYADFNQGCGPKADRAASHHCYTARRKMAQLTRIRLAEGRRANTRRIAVGCLDGESVETPRGPSAVADTIGALSKRRDWRADRGRYVETATAAGHVVSLHGLGEATELTFAGLDKWLKTVVDDAAKAGFKSCSIVLPAHPLTRGRAAAQAILREIALSSYRFHEFRSSSEPAPLASVQLLAPPDSLAAYRKERNAALAVAEGTALARDLGNTPPNRATPVWIASRARSLARRHGMKLQVLDPREMSRRGMGGILAVGGGSAAPPRMVKMEWGRRGPRVALVGKGVTFDTGGISIKPAADMDEMKYDKCGACTVLGIGDAVARAGLPIRLRLYLPLAENMPSAKAYRPGDIVRCYNKKTVEILNTDAEGRMILADALAWAARDKPEHLLEYSTLTGAAVVALGETGGALFSPADELAAGLLQAASEAEERLWRMPLWPEFKEQMKGNHADLKNTGGRWGGACTAAAFLSHFVDDHPSWAHLDIAGPAMRKNPKGASGYGVASTFRWLSSLSAARTARVARPNSRTGS